MPLFRVYVERIDGPLNAELPDSLTFVAKNHDDMLDIAGKVRHLPDMEPDETAALAIGLKLFGEVLLKHRRKPPYAELLPHFRTFVEAFKAGIRTATADRTDTAPGAVTHAG